MFYNHEKMENKLRVAIIGLGVGERHIQGFDNSPGCTVRILCDFNIDKLTELKLKYPNVQFSDNAEEVIRNPEIDIVSIASYDNYHFEQVKLAIECGKHIFVEKPLCLTEKEYMEIASLLKANPQIKLSSNLILRCETRFLKLKKKIENNQLGLIYHLEGDYEYGRVHKLNSGWRGEIDNYSVVSGGAIHMIDLILWFLNKKVIQVFAYGNKIITSKSRFRYNDFATSLLKFENGVIAKITANFGCVTPHFHRLSVYGSLGTFFQSFSGGAVYIESRDPMKSAIADLESYPSALKGDLIKNFVLSITEREVNPVVSTQDVLDVMAISLAIDKSIKSNKPEQPIYVKLKNYE